MIQVRISMSDGGCTLWLGVTLDGSAEPVWFQSVEIDDAGIANAVRIALEARLAQKTEDMRRCAYFKGRRSMRDKKQRVKVFNDCFNSDTVGW